MGRRFKSYLGSFHLLEFSFLYALVAQWTRARGYELRCRGFESLLARLVDQAGVAELVDARDLGSRVHDVRVRVSPPVFILMK